MRRWWVAEQFCSLSPVASQRFAAVWFDSTLFCSSELTESVQDISNCAFTGNSARGNANGGVFQFWLSARSLANKLDVSLLAYAFRQVQAAARLPTCWVALLVGALFSAATGWTAPRAAQYFR